MSYIFLRTDGVRQALSIVGLWASASKAQPDFVAMLKANGIEQNKVIQVYRDRHRLDQAVVRAVLKEDHEGVHVRQLRFDVQFEVIESKDATERHSAIAGRGYDPRNDTGRFE